MIYLEWCSQALVHSSSSQHIWRWPKVAGLKFSALWSEGQDDTFPFHIHKLTRLAAESWRTASSIELGGIMLDKKAWGRLHCTPSSVLQHLTPALCPQLYVPYLWSWPTWKKGLDMLSPMWTCNVRMETATPGRAVCSHSPPCNRPKDIIQTDCKGAR